MTEENVFHWNFDKIYNEEMKKLPEWARKQGNSLYFEIPEIVPAWIRGDYQVGYYLTEADCYNSTHLTLYVRVKYIERGCSKWLPYTMLYPRDFYLIPEIVEYLLNGNAERVYESFVKERNWKNQRTGE